MLGRPAAKWTLLILAAVYQANAYCMQKVCQGLVHCDRVLRGSGFRHTYVYAYMYPIFRSPFLSPRS